MDATIRPLPVRIPPGFRAVWEDDRLNPQRGPRTARGDAQMALVWTDTVPMQLAKPTVPAAAAPRFLRVGAYDTDTAARPTVRTIQGLGLPVSRASGQRAGQPVQVIYAGPFRDAAALARAETRLKRAGFFDLEYRK
ncbi:SPOR domain-containing protein [Rhodovulum strictum]|uniref:SPOR domain-containing protein n=1 Tax=Rhodovulum strictum TaxID=58314 RepID=A0A844BK20_9RHOB|nr:hypothetical protein [Rhodovulum strictum]MRH21293.1 hypothetical protein [Rhodovulum strictum]